MTILEAFKTALQVHYDLCSHPHSLLDFTASIISNTFFQNDHISTTLIVSGTKDGKLAQETLIFTGDVDAGVWAVMDKINNCLRDMDKVLFPTRLMKILQEEIP